MAATDAGHSSDGSALTGDPLQRLLRGTYCELAFTSSSFHELLFFKENTSMTNPEKTSFPYLAEASMSISAGHRGGTGGAEEGQLAAAAALEAEETELRLERG